MPLGKRRACALTCLFVVLGCGAPGLLSARLDALREVVLSAERQGAMRCSPRALAMAQAHEDFARAELRRGELTRAEAHLRIAEPNARAARDGSPATRCAASGETRAIDDRDRDGVPDAQDRCPAVAEDLDGSEDRDGCPEPDDADGDGIFDAEDLCPLEEEDRDGHLDDDGCPEIDNDVDGVLDEVDDCPLEPEDIDGFADDDGCPDLDNDGDGAPDPHDRCPNARGPREENGCPRVYPGVRVTPTGLALTVPIRFDTGRTRVSRASRETLKTIAQILRDEPERVLSIIAHTDARPRFSGRRADAIRDVLVEEGIPLRRIRALGRRVGRGEEARGVRFEWARASGP